MTQPSTISVETPPIRKITFSNPPVNLMVNEAAETAGWHTARQADFARTGA